MNWSRFCWFCFYAITMSNAYLISIDINDEACFHEFLSNRSKMAVIYDVVDGGFRDIRFLLTAPNLTVIHDDSVSSPQPTSSTGRYVFSAQTDGEHRFCFINNHTSSAIKNVKFIVESESFLPQFKDIEQQEEITARYIHELSSQLTWANHESQFAIYAKKSHNSLNDEINFYVVTWAIFECLTAVIIVLLQVIYLRQLFLVCTHV